MDRLTPVATPAELRAIRELYEGREGPADATGRQTLRNYSEWWERGQRTDVAVYTLSGDWRGDGLYLVVDRFQLFVNTLSEAEGGAERLARALRLLDWSRGFKVMAMAPPLLPVVERVVRQQGIRAAAARMVVYQMPRAEARRLPVDCPAGFRLRPLRPDDARTVNAHWPNRHPGSLTFVRTLIRLNPSLGLCSEPDGELVAWCTRCQAGFLGTLQVRERHRRRGFASLVVRAFAREVAAATDDDVRALVYEHNEASKALFHQLGFREAGSAHHMKAFRSPNGVEWPEEEEEEEEENS